jgi:hypothetical protein
MRARFLGWNVRFRGRGYSGQIIVLGTLLVFFFVLIAAVLIDVYHLEEARSWGYAVAQQSAITGASRGRDWEAYAATPDITVPLPTPREDHCVEPGKISLNEGIALDAATKACQRELNVRGIAGSCEVHVLKDSEGGTAVPGWPSGNVRLGGGLGDWDSDTPAVAVYITFPVHTFFMSMVGRSNVTMSVFGSAAVAQPLPCPTLTKAGP